MVFIAGKQTRICVGEEELSKFFNDFDLTPEAQALETSAFGQNDRTYIVGLRNGALSLNGFFDADADAIDAELSALLGQVAGEPISLGPDGWVIGKRIYVLAGKQTTYGVSGAVDAVVAVTAEFQADGGIQNGVSLHDLVAETASGNGANVDNGAATTVGGVAHVHLTAVTAVGGDTMDVIIQQSTTGAFGGEETTLATFTQFTTTKTSQRIILTGTIEQFTRANFTKGGAGSPSYTFGVALSRAVT